MRKNFKTIYASAVVAAMVLTATPVAAKTKGSIKSVTVSNLPAKTLTLKKGKTKTLKFKVKKSGKISTALAYKTSNKKVATVSKKGVVKAKKKGKAKITAYAKKNKKKKTVITVTVGTPVTKIKLNKSKVTITKGKTYTLKAKISPKKPSNKKVIWKTSNKKIAKVSSKGKVTAVKKGTAKITATAADGSGKKATAKVTVKNKAKTTKKTPVVTPTAASAATVQDPRNVSLTLNKAQALDKSQITVQSKSSEAANYRTTDEIKSISTTDNVNYNIFLKNGESIDDDENVRVTVTGLNDNPTASVVETYYSGLVKSSTDEETIALKKGSRTSVTLFDGNDYSNYYTYEVTSGSLPAGLSRDEKKFGTYVVYGSPTANSDVTIKRTSPHGDTLTKTFHFRVYDKDTLAFNNVTNTYNLSKSIDDKNTDVVSDDTLENPKVDVDLDTSGGSKVYKEATYVKNDGTVSLSEDDYETQEDAAGDAARQVEKDKYGSTDDGSYYKTSDIVEKTVAKTDPEYDYNKATTADGKTVYVKNGAKTVTVDETTDKTKLTEVKGSDETSGTVFYDKSDVLSETDYKQATDDFNNYVAVDDSHAVAKSKLVSSDDYYDALSDAYSKGESDFDQQYTYSPREYTHYEIVGDAHGLSISQNGRLTGELAGSASVTVKATAKNSAGAEISDTTTLNFNVEDTKLIKGTVTDINGKAVPGAGITFDNRKADSPFGGTTVTTDGAGQYEAAVENSTYYVTTYDNQSDSFTKDVALNADNNAYNLSLDTVVVTLAPADPNVYIPYALYDDNNYSYRVERVRSDTDNNGNYDHTDGYVVALENGTTYNLVSSDTDDYYYYYNSPSNGYNVSVSNLTINGNTTTSAVLNVNKK